MDASRVLSHSTARPLDYLFWKKCKQKNEEAARPSAVVRGQSRSSLHYSKGRSGMFAHLHTCGLIGNEVTTTHLVSERLSNASRQAGNHHFSQGLQSSVETRRTSSYSTSYSMCCTSSIRNTGILIPTSARQSLVYSVRWLAPLQEEADR